MPTHNTHTTYIHYHTHNILSHLHILHCFLPLHIFFLSFLSFPNPHVNILSLSLSLSFALSLSLSLSLPMLFTLPFLFPPLFPSLFLQWSHYLFSLSLSFGEQDVWRRRRRRKWSKMTRQALVSFVGCLYFLFPVVFLRFAGKVVSSHLVCILFFHRVKKYIASKVYILLRMWIDGMGNGTIGYSSSSNRHLWK